MRRWSGCAAILNQKEFDEELVHELIKRIYVGMDNSVEVEFKCSDPYQEVLAFMWRRCRMNDKIAIYLRLSSGRRRFEKGQQGREQQH